MSSRSGAESRTSATSRVVRGSAESCMSISAWPMSSMALTTAAVPILAAWASTSAVADSDSRTRDRALVARNPLRRCSKRAVPSRRASRPDVTASATLTSTPPASRSIMASTSSATRVVSSSTEPAAATWSSADSASRAEPCPRLTTTSMASGGSCRSAWRATSWSREVSTSEPRSRNSKCCVRLRIVSSTFCGSVVANTKITWPGGSSNVLSRALAAAGVIWWTSSTMYTFHRPGVPSDTRLSRSRVSSMPRLVAESSSCTSRDAPLRMATHEPHVPQGSPSSACSQLSAIARMRAVLVLPVPRGPLKR